MIALLIVERVPALLFPVAKGTALGIHLVPAEFLECCLDLRRVDVSSRVGFRPQLQLEVAGALEDLGLAGQVEEEIPVDDVRQSPAHTMIRELVEPADPLDGGYASEVGRAARPVVGDA